MLFRSLGDDGGWGDNGDDASSPPWDAGAPIAVDAIAPLPPGDSGSPDAIPPVDAGVDAPCTQPVGARDLLIDELMIESVAGAGDDGEWLEVASTASCAVNLRGLHGECPVGSKVHTFDVVEDTWLLPGGTFIIADSQDPAVNHDLPGLVLAWSGHPGDVLRNLGGTVTLSDGDVPVVSLTWPSLLPLVGATVELSRPIAPSRTPTTSAPGRRRRRPGVRSFIGTPNAPNTDVAESPPGNRERASGTSRDAASDAMLPVMSLLHSRKLAVPGPSEALPGRSERARRSPRRHAVLGTAMQAPFPPQMRLAMSGMGCFWGAEKLFLAGPWASTRRRSVTPEATRRTRRTSEVCSKADTAHAEVVRVVFDPTKVSFGDLLRVFWESHDPTQGMRQGNDTGTQYRSAIYVYDDDQRAHAEASRRAYEGRPKDAGARRDHDRGRRRGRVPTSPRTALTSSTSLKNPRRVLRHRGNRGDSFCWRPQIRVIFWFEERLS